MQNRVFTFWKILKKSFADFIGGDNLKYSASLSYYTVFSITPVLVIIISLVSLFYGKEAVTGEIYQQFSALMGPQAADMILGALHKINLSGQNAIATVVGLSTLLLGATAIFAELQDTLNKIWNIKVHAERGWMKYITNRLISFSMVLTLGFLLLVSLMINASIAFLSQRLIAQFGTWAEVVNSLNMVVIFVVITSLFAFIFKFLPDALIEWRDVTVGAMFTTLLFLGGKFLIGYYLSNSSVATVFGAAGSLALLLVWVYYSSAILFFGAEFTKNYVLAHGRKIMPDEYAHFVVNKQQELSPNADALKAETARQVELAKKQGVPCTVEASQANIPRFE